MSREQNGAGGAGRLTGCFPPSLLLDYLIYCHVHVSLY